VFGVARGLAAEPEKEKERELVGAGVGR